MCLLPACSQEALQTGEVKLIKLPPSENSLPSHHLSQQHFLTFSSVSWYFLHLSKVCPLVLSKWHSSVKPQEMHLGTLAFMEYQKVSLLPSNHPISFSMMVPQWLKKKAYNASIVTKIAGIGENAIEIALCFTV